MVLQVQCTLKLKSYSSSKTGAFYGLLTPKKSLWPLLPSQPQLISHQILQFTLKFYSISIIIYSDNQWAYHIVNA